MPRLAEAVAILKTIFHQYASKDGDATSLSKKELADLLRTEIGTTDTETVEAFFSMLDADGNGTVDFKEFVSFAISLCLMS